MRDGLPGLGWAALGLCALGLGAAASLPLVAGEGSVVGSLGRAAVPYGALAVLVVLAHDGRLATWAAFVGTLLTLALGLALYRHALAAGPAAVRFALHAVPTRQTVAVAVAAYGVWIARRARRPPLRPPHADS